MTDTSCLGACLNYPIDSKLDLVIYLTVRQQLYSRYHKESTLSFTTWWFLTFKNNLGGVAYVGREKKLISAVYCQTKNLIGVSKIYSSFATKEQNCNLQLRPLAKCRHKNSRAALMSILVNKEKKISELTNSLNIYGFKNFIPIV